MDNALFTADLQRASAIVRSGGVVLYPTDTVWGIGCDSASPEAVRRVFGIKRRDDAKALISLVDSLEMLERTVGQLTSELRELVMSERPTTVIFDNPRGLAPEMLAADGSAALRLTREPFSASLARALGRPLVSTSANISGQPAPDRWDAIDPAIVESVDFAPSYGRESGEEPRRPSRIVRVAPDNTLIFIRR